MSADLMVTPSSPVFSFFYMGLIMNILKKFADLKYEDITESDLYTIEGLISMGRGAWDMVDHRELVLACVKAVRMKFPQQIIPPVNIGEIEEKIKDIWEPIIEMREEGASYEDQAGVYEYACERLDTLLCICIKKLKEIE